MKLKLLIGTLLLVVTTNFNCRSQYFTLGLQTGFGIGIPDATYGTYSTLRYSAAWGYVVEELNGSNSSLGQGLPVDIEFGYASGSGITFGVSGGYVYGLKQSVSYGVQYYADKDERTATYKGHFFHASPYLGVYKRWQRWGFSLRAYPLFAFPKFSVTTDIQLPNNPNGTKGDSYQFIREYKGPLTVGFKGSFDIEHIFKSEKQAIFFGISYTHLSFSPNSSEVTTYQVNGHDDIESLSTNDRYSEYSNVQEITYDFNPDGSINWTQHENEPYKNFKFDIPFDNFAFNIGFRLYFNRPSKKTKDDKPPL